MDSQLATREQSLATQEPSIGSLLQTVLQQNATTENAAVIEKMMALYERNQDRQAVAAYNRAFCELQADMPTVQATAFIPGSNNEVRSRFAPFPEIMRTVQPYLQKHGFSVTFNQSFDGPRVKVSCTLRHKDGHSETNEFFARIGNGPPKSSEAQADGAVTTYAKRGALCNALNIVVDHDTDGRADSAKIDAETAAKIRLRLKATKGDEAKFLEFVGAASFEDIFESSMEQIEEVLARREAKAKSSAATEPLSQEDRKW